NPWHKRLGHPSSVFHELLSSPYKELTFCDISPLAKIKRTSFCLSHSRFDALFAMVHVDIWGSSPIESIDNYKYFLTVVDDYFICPSLVSYYIKLVVYSVHI